MLVGVPADGDTGVPTDVVLYYAGSVPGLFELRDASGAQVAVTARPVGISAFELSPARPLRANTRYTLSVTWNLSLELTFETGSGPLGTAPEPPRALVHNFVLAHNYSSECGPPQSGSCVSVADDSAWLVYTILDDFGQEHETVTARGSFQVNPLKNSNLPCVDIRTRALNGTRSAPLRLCGTDGPLHDLTVLEDRPRLQCSAAGLAWCDGNGHEGMAVGVSGASSSSDALRCPASTATSASQLAADGSAAGSLASAAAPVAGSPSPSAGASCSVARRSSRPAASFWALGVLVAGAALLRRVSSKFCLPSKSKP